MTEFNGKVALVTGGGRGLGAAISRRLAEGGARVIVADRDQAPAIETAEVISSAGFAAAPLVLDVRDPAQVKASVAAVTATFGAVELLVNNAGISQARPFLEHSLEDWDAHLEINLRGTFLMCQAFLPDMVARRSGRIVNMSSALGREGHAGFAAYCSSKFGVIGLTQCIAAEFGAYDITVNSVIPGIVKTRMWSGEDGTVGTVFESEQAAEDFLKARLPLGRTQEPEDLAEMVAFLLSDKARNVTASAFHVDGGLVPR
jgi:NAD(P)-dependent dehydrogenase (short-subunit alcohol dehydrogenase family)